MAATEPSFIEMPSDLLKEVAAFISEHLFYYDEEGESYNNEGAFPLLTKLRAYCEKEGLTNV